MELGPLPGAAGSLARRHAWRRMKPRTQLAELIMGAGLVGGSAKKKPAEVSEEQMG